MARRHFRWALIGLLVCPLAQAVPPTPVYSPPPDGPGTDLLLQPVAEDQLDGVIAISNGTPPGAAGEITTLICNLGGPENIQFSGPSSLLFDQDIPPGSSITVTCDDQPDATMAVLSCDETRGFTSIERVWDVLCPAQTGTPMPEIEPLPLPGTALSMTATQPTDVTTQISVANAGSAALTVSSISGLAAPFTVSPPNATISPGASQDFTITCDAASQGVFVDELTINSNDADEPALMYPVDCSVGGAPAAEFDATPAAPGPIDLFASAGGGADQQFVVIENLGTTTLTLSTTPGSGAISATLGDTAISPGGSTTLTLACQSGSATSTSQQITLTTNDPNEGSVAYTVNCTVSASPQPEFSSIPAAPGPFNFITPQGGAAPEQTLTLENVGNAPLNLSINTAPTSPVTLTGVPASIPAGGSANATVSCATGTAGTFNRSFTLTTNDGNEGTVNFNVSCLVVAGASAEVTPNPAPSTLTFSTNQGVIGTRTITFTNAGNANLILDPITDAGPDAATFSTTPAAPISIAPGASSVLTVRCLSGSARDHTATLTVTTNDPDDGEGTLVYALSCRVNLVAPDLTTSPAAGSTFFVYLNATQTATFKVGIGNAGNATLTFTQGFTTPMHPALSTNHTGTAPLGSITPRGQANDGSETLLITCDGADLPVNGNVDQIFRVSTNDPDETRADFRVRCLADVRESAVPLLNSLLGSSLLTDGSDNLFSNGFE